MNDRRRTFRLISIAILTVGLVSAGLVMAASIPAWLDDAIANWNQKNPHLPIEFIEIQDSFVWYMVPRIADVGSAEIRQRIYTLAQEHGYKMTDTEELVTTGKPPTPTDRHQAKKCWKRSFILTIDVGRQRMLNTMVCEDAQNWYTGFRILQ